MILKLAQTSVAKSNELVEEERVRPVGWRQCYSLTLLGGKKSIWTVKNEGGGGRSGTVGVRSPGCFCWVLLKRCIPKSDQHS